MTAALTLILMTGSMAVLGLIVWRVLGKQEEGDARFKERLDADDARAEAGRQEEALRRAAWEEHKRQVEEARSQARSQKGQR